MTATVSDMRKTTGMSQREFAELFGIPVRTLQQWEQGKSAPSPYLITMMEKLLAQSVANKGDKSGQREKSEKQATRYTIPKRSSWKICISDPFDNCEKVYPIQQRKVRQLIDDLSQNPNVMSLRVFGSSVTESCHMGSDVDLYVELSNEGSIQDGDGRSLTNKTYDFEFDLWTNHSVDSRLEKEIRDKGVVVYER